MKKLTLIELPSLDVRYVDGLAILTLAQKFTINELEPGRVNAQATTMLFRSAPNTIEATQVFMDTVESALSGNIR